MAATAILRCTSYYYVFVRSQLLVVSRSYRATSDATLELAQSKSLCGLRVNFVGMSRIAHRQERPLAAAGSAVDVDRSEQTP